MSDSDDLKELKERAAAAGLTLLTEEHLKQLQRAAAGSRRHKANLTVELSIADEPAHVYSLIGKG